MKSKQAIGWIKNLFQLINHDFCPGANRYVYWLKRPIGWVISAIMGSLLVGLLIGPQGYVLAVAFAALLAIGLVWPWISIKGLRCELVLPEGSCWEDQEIKVGFRVRNYWPMPVFGLIVEGNFLQDIHGEDKIAFSLKRVPPFSEVEYTVPITPTHRGQLPTGEVEIKNGFPFGLYEFSKPLEYVSRTVVWPSCQSLDGQPQHTGLRFTALGTLNIRAGNDGDAIGIRTYQPGDQIRSIHWPQTVRSQRLMVRERQSISPSEATVWLDLSPSSHAGQGMDNSYESAIRIAANICFELHQTNSHVRICCKGLLDDGFTIGNEKGVRKLMDYLSTLPSLEQASAEALSTSGKAMVLPSSSSGQLILVASSESELLQWSGADVQPFVVGLESFAEGVEENSSERANAGPVLQHAAARQFVQTWNRRFESAAC